MLTPGVAEHLSEGEQDSQMWIYIQHEKHILRRWLGLDACGTYYPCILELSPKSALASPNCSLNSCNTIHIRARSNPERRLHWIWVTTVPAAVAAGRAGAGSHRGATGPGLAGTWPAVLPGTPAGDPVRSTWAPPDTDRVMDNPASAAAADPDSASGGDWWGSSLADAEDSWMQ